MKNEFSLYIHWPFCLKKCPYCDFNSYVFQHEKQDWVNSLFKELTIYSKIFPKHTIKTIFFGGGTPSLIPPQYIGKIIQTIKSLWPLKNNIEITLEINPASIERHSLEQFLQNQINRFSIGAQSFNDTDLKFLGRLHSSQEAKDVLTEATKLNPNVSADFIYTLPYDSLSKWKKDLDHILKFTNQINLNHLSLYQLTIENNTKFGEEVKTGKWKPMNQDQQSILYRYTHKIFNQIKWNQYEISNYAKNTNFECQHNLAYWKYKQYLGIGPGAHSRMIINNHKYQFNNYKNPLKWQNFLNESNQDNLKFLEEKKKLSIQEQLIEKLLMGLRLTNGITLDQNEMQYLNKENFNLLLKTKFIKIKNDHYYLSLHGKLKLNAILKMIIK